MKPEKWFSDLLESFEEDFDFRLETIILDLTEKITKRMSENNINRTQLADLLNVSPPAVTKILNGTSNFTLKTLLSLTDALELNLRVDFEAMSIALPKVVDIDRFEVAYAGDEPVFFWGKELPIAVTVNSSWTSERVL